MHLPPDDNAPDERGRVATRRQIITALAAGVSMPLSAPVWADPPAGRVADIAGEAHAEQSSNRRALALNANVMVGDLVSTGTSSRLGVELGPKTRIRLGQSSRLKIDKYLAGTGGDFMLEAGVMKFDSSAKLDKPDLQFRSAYGLIAVRGTRFYMGKLDGKFAVLVGTGSVAVTAAGTTVMLRAGEGTDIAEPGRAPGPAKAWAAERVRRMVRQVE